MPRSHNLDLARTRKDDEFYTRLSDIEAELCHHKSDLPGKHVHMPCDDYRVSNFWRYFYENFSRLGLRKITAMHYTRDGSRSSLVSYDGASLTVKPLKGDGAFQSEEGRSAIAACDIVVTNPPFSVWTQFFATLLESSVSYIIVGTIGKSVTRDARKELLSYRLSTGKWPRVVKFLRPDGHTIMVDGCVFFTNIRPFSHSAPVKLDVRFDPAVHERYDDYDAVNCNRGAHIPKDYQGAIGVPISFIEKLCPEQFEILGLARPHINGRTLFVRFLIRNKNPAP